MAAPTYEPVIFTDVASGATGTAQNAASLNTFVVSNTCLLNGTTPSTSASLVLTYGQQQFVVQSNTAGVDTGVSAAFYTLAGGTLTVATNKDTYIEVSSTGAITQNAVGNGAGAPVQTSNTIRLWKVVSSGTAITSVTLLASTYGVQVVGNLTAATVGLSKMNVPAQTGNNGASSVANISMGTFRIPASSGAGVTAFNQTVPNTQVTAISVLFLTICAPIDIITAVATLPGSNVANTSFTVNITKGSTSATGSAVDVNFLIVN